MNRLCFIILCSSLSGCANDNSDSNETDGSSSGSQGSLQIETQNMKAIIDDVNAALGEGEELDVAPAGYQSLPGSVQVENKLWLQDEFGLIEYWLTIGKFQLSETGGTWIDLPLGSNTVDLELINGGDGVTAAIAPGTYKYAYLEIPEYAFTRAGGCTKQVQDVVDFAAVLTTAAEAGTLGQDFAPLFDTNLSHEYGDPDDYQENETRGYWDDLQEIFWHLRSRPVDLLESFDQVARSDEGPISVGEARSSSDREGSYPGPETTDNSDGGRDVKLGINTHSRAEGLPVDSYYWLLSQPITITAGEAVALIITMDPTGDILKADPCDESPSDPKFIIGTREQVVSQLKTLGRKLKAE